jgi:Na+-driven multidrug efflux pump
LLSSTGRTVAAGLGGAVGLVTVAILDVLWIPLWGLIGAAEASAIAYLAMGVVAAWELHKEAVNERLSPPVPVRLPGGDLAGLSTETGYTGVSSDS